MKKKIIIIVMLSFLIIATSISPAYGWTNSLYKPYPSYIAVHDDDTEQWCKNKGFGRYEANVISFHCDSVDILFKKDYRWHLDRRKFTGEKEDTRIIQSRNEMTIAKRKIDEISKLQDKLKNTYSSWKKFKLRLKIRKVKEEALMYLGRSLHPIQDLYAHMDAGVDTPDEKIGNSHGMLDAPPVDVKIIYENGNTEIRKMKIETMDSSGRFNYSFYDDINYDYVDGQWIFRENCKKEDNSRWIKTRDATYELLDEFLEYAKKKNVDFN